MGHTVTKIQSLGIEVQHIPGSCTYLCQPINNVVNKSIKKQSGGAVGGLDGYRGSSRR